jgi:hypothetical protein
MRLGKIQQDVVSFLARCGEGGGVICSTTRAAEFRGYDLNQVERAISGLLRRSIIRREGIKYILTMK